jgi:hypothetical protein
MMRIWDIPVEKLCRQHLLGMHRECHAIFNIITQGKKGYANHPEVRRWRGKLAALNLRHGDMVAEMQRRGYKHNSPLPCPNADLGEVWQDEYWQRKEKQIKLLRAKCIECRKRLEA